MKTVLSRDITSSYLPWNHNCHFLKIKQRTRNKIVNNNEDVLNKIKEMKFYTKLVYARSLEEQKTKTLVYETNSLNS